MPKDIFVLGPPGTGKCVIPDTLILTSDGLVRAGSLCDAWPAVDQTAPLVKSVYGISGLQITSGFYNGGIKDTTVLTTSKGYELQGTRVHPVWSLREGVPQWLQLGQIRLTDKVAVQPEVCPARGSSGMSYAASIQGQALGPHIWDAVQACVEGPRTNVIDLVVPEGHSFIGNGIICHNTTAMVTVSKGWFKSGTSTSEVAYLAFTKAASREAAGRVMDEEFKKDFGDQLPYFRTLHSLAYMGLRKAKPDVRLVTTSDMKAFSKWSSLQGTYTLTQWEDLSDVYRKLQERGKNDKTTWDECLTAHTLSRISARNENDLDAAKVQMSNIACAAVGRLDPEAYRMFVEKYETYKETNGLVDFTDMLVYALTEMPPIEDVKYAVIDECQDLAPILYSITDRLFQNAGEIWHAGDDDQSIFKFSAADAGLFIARARKATQIFLQQTHRFGNEIVEFSKEIISRVSDRVKKEVLGKIGREHSIRLTGDFTPTAMGNTLLIHRLVAGCQALCDIYMDSGMPFRNERGKDPLGADIQILGYQALKDLADGKTVSMGSVARLVEELLPSMVIDEGKGGKKTRLVVHGAKKKLQNSGGLGDVNVMDLIRAGILTTDGADVIRQKSFRVFKPEVARNFEYYDRVVENGFALDGECPIITTIHGAKGRQAERVTVFSEMGQRCWGDPDSEHRLAYVAATRTQRDLEICAENMVNYARKHYNYPVPNKGSGMTPVVTGET